MGLTGLHWTSWTSHLASGYGTYFLNDCTPTCAGGHFHTYPALVALWGNAAVKGHPSERKYTRMTPGSHGPGAGGTTTAPGPLRCARLPA